MTRLRTPPTAPEPAGPSADLRTLADLLDHLGGIDPARVRLRPAPGTATERDLIEVNDREDLICELIDGTLVEKAVGVRESFLAGFLIAALRGFVDPRNLGMVLPPDGMLRLFPGRVRAPDVSFIAWGHIPGGKIPTKPIPDLTPDLAVEVLSRSNTRREMARKRREYFAAGTRLVWEIDPKKRIATVYTGPETGTVLDASATLGGGDVLPGFALPLADLFAELDREAPE